MADPREVGNIAPFIDQVFTVTSSWWVERWGTIHKGLDIAIGGSEDVPVYSMLDGYVIDKGYTESAGNYLIIANEDINSGLYGFATRYLHLKNDSIQVNIGDRVQVNQWVAYQGDTGSGVTGKHLHVEMQNVAINTPRFTWKFSNNKSDYIDPTRFMGIENVEGTEWIYRLSIPTPTSEEKTEGFKWVLYSRKLRNKRKL